MKCFEDYSVGQCEESQGRTVTEADVVNFSNISWDHKAIHTDEVFAKSHSSFGTRVAHGMLGLVIASGLTSNLDIFRDIAVVAFSRFSWEFKKPIFIGDTLRARVEILEKEERPGKNTGTIRLERKLLNQEGRVVQQGISEMVVHKVGD